MHKSTKALYLFSLLCVFIVLFFCLRLLPKILLPLGLTPGHFDQLMKVDPIEVEEFEKILYNTPRTWKYHMGAGLIYLDKDIIRDGPFLDKAVSEFEKAIALDQQNPSVYMELINALLKKGEDSRNLQRILELILKAEKISPKNSLFDYLYASMVLNTDRKTALEKVEKGISKAYFYRDIDSAMYTKLLALRTIFGISEIARKNVAMNVEDELLRQIGRLAKSLCEMGDELQNYHALIQDIESPYNIPIHMSRQIMRAPFRLTEFHLLHALHFRGVGYSALAKFYRDKGQNDNADEIIRIRSTWRNEFPKLSEFSMSLEHIFYEGGEKAVEKYFDILLFQNIFSFSEEYVKKGHKNVLKVLKKHYPPQHVPPVEILEDAE